MSLMQVKPTIKIPEIEIKPKSQIREAIVDVSKESNLPTLIITKSVISLYSIEDMKKIQVVNITNNKLNEPNSPNDPKMGIVSLTSRCSYCSQIDCPGHYGIINFKSPIYNPIYISEIASVLRCVCNSCGKLLISEDEIRQKGILKLPFDKRLKALEKECKSKECLRNEFKRDPKIEGPIISCSKNKTFVTKSLKETGKIEYVVENEHFPMSVEAVSDILNRISNEDARLLGFSPGSHPRNMILKALLVPPIVARPPNYNAGLISHDQLTHMYCIILQKVKNANDINSITDLYNEVKQLFFKTEGKKIGLRDFISITEKIQGKTALIRGLLMGKRNNHCGRTVAGPDSSLRFGQIRLPKVWASILTKKEKVNEMNINRLQELLRKGRITHITQKGSNIRRHYQRYKSEIGDTEISLQIGDTVERWLQNGDRIVVNRQPTLHKQSMMACEVVLGYQNTIGLHLSYTTPMNCDFDGDENNVWNPQDFEVEAEAEILLNVKNNIMSTESNKPIMGLVMNSITGAYLLSDPKVRINNDLFNELIQLITNTQSLNTLYHRLIKYRVHPRSGQAIFSALLPDDFYYNYKNVLIIEGILISGRVTKSHVGTSHRSIIQELHKKYGPQRTSEFLTDASWVINKWLIERGFTVGLSDMIYLEVDKDGKKYDKSKEILNEELAKIYVNLEALGGKSDDPIEEMYRQRQINNLVNIAQGIGLSIAKKVLNENNSIGIMTERGANTKGGMANIGQMFGAVGQQNYKGERLKATLSGGRRLLPTQDLDDNSPEAHGFIPDSFMTGLNPEGLFFLQAGARESLLDTALKTSETGSMQRRMIKAFENIIIGYDGSIRNTIGTMFAPTYNSGYDIAEMLAVKKDDKPDFSSFIDIKSVIEELNFKRGWVTQNIKKQILEKENLSDFKENILNTSDTYKGPKIQFKKNFKSVTYQRHNYKITKFEKSRIIGTRAMQLSNNSKPLIKTNETDLVKIAMMEYNQGLLSNFQIVRKFADGSYQLVRPTLENINLSIE